jgi:hypothetical protein
MAVAVAVAEFSMITITMLILSSPRRAFLRSEPPSLLRVVAETAAVMIAMTTTPIRRRKRRKKMSAHGAAPDAYFGSVYP